MPKYYDIDDDPNYQEWEPVKISNKDRPESEKDELTSVSDFRKILTTKRNEMNLSLIQMNCKCKFSDKYIIRDIESGKIIPTLSQVKIINKIIGTNIKLKYI